MRIKLFFLGVLVLIFSACQKDDTLEKAPHDAKRPTQSDLKPNGGFVRFTLDEKPMHDSFFEAQFTPRGDVFELDNLQIYNYNLGSGKYPRIIISIDYKESTLQNWEGLTFSLQNSSFVASAETPAMAATGEVTIKSVNEKFIEGSFDGLLKHPREERTFQFRGEFKAAIKVNV